MLDLLIRGGTVIDGTGAPGFSADVAVEGGVIAAVEPLPPDTPARRVIHAAGKLVTPGFIDIHRHADAAAFRPGFGELELRQGLTTIVNGNCGLSAAPFGPVHREEILAYLAPITGEAPPELETETLAGYLPPSHRPLSTRGCWWGPVSCGRMRRATPSSDWKSAITTPSTAAWSGRFRTAPWACRWGWAMPRSASIPPGS